MNRLGTTALHPSTVLPAYADTLFRARRVAILGDSSFGLGELFAERGARSVHVFDPDAARAAEATTRAAVRSSTLAVRPQFGALSEDLGVRQGAFDLVFVPDLSLLRSVPGLVREVKRLLTPSGIAFLAAPNPDAERWLLPPSTSVGDALGYYEFYDLVASSFTEVRMLGQAPFVGYALVDFSSDDPQVSIDTSGLAEPEVPEWYVAVASDRPVELSDFALVEVSLADVARATFAVPEPRTIPVRANDDARDLALAEAETRIAMLAAENERLAAEAKRIAIENATRDRAHEALSMRVGELENELNDGRARHSEMEQLAGEAHARAERLGHQVRDLDEELVRERERAGRLAKRLDDEEKTLAPALARVDELQKALADAGDPPTLRSLEKEQARRIAELERREKEATAAHHQAREELLLLKRELAARPSLAPVEEHHARELAALEDVLRERARVVTQLTSDVREAERIGRELVRENEALRRESTGVLGSPQGGGPSGSDDRGPSTTDRDKERAARAEADAAASAWRIAQLEREAAVQLRAAASPDREREILERALVSAQAEIAGLRQAIHGRAVFPVDVTTNGAPRTESKEETTT